MPRGRPTKYRPEFAGQAEKLCKLGATDVELADFFGVATQTIDNWKARYQEFLGALKSGKTEADERVERSLYQKAVGYTFDTEKVFQFQGKVVRAKVREHVPPSDVACIFWLKNRQSGQWRDKTEAEVTHRYVARMPDVADSAEQWQKQHLPTTH